MTARFCVLVVAKAPVPGFAKTRLCPPATPAQAANIAAAAMLDTLDAAAGVTDAVTVVAMTGDLTKAARANEIIRALRGTTVIPQRGNDFGHRLANAHADTATAYPGLPILQIGMDTPQVTADSLAAAMTPIRSGQDAVLGPAEDGGWWALGLAEPRHARVLAGVPMSREDTGERTRLALTGVGLRTALIDTLSDVDTVADARRVATLCPRGRFAQAVGAVAGEVVAG